MASRNRNPSRRADRVQLILEVRRAYRRLAELLQQCGSDSPPMRAAFVQATDRLSAMNRTLALAAVESARRSRFAGVR